MPVLVGRLGLRARGTEGEFCLLRALGMQGDPGVVEMVTSFESFKVCGLRALGTEGDFAYSVR